MGRTARGVIAIRLNEGDDVIGFYPGRTYSLSEAETDLPWLFSANIDDDPYPEFGIVADDIFDKCGVLPQRGLHRL